MNFKDRNFFANGDKEFFYIEIDDQIELRNWDNFWKKIDDGAEFLKRLNTCRTYFNHGEGGERNVNKLSLKDHYKTTLAKEMWRDVYNQNYLFMPEARNYCNEMLPQDEKELEYLRCGYFDKAGFYFRNKDFGYNVMKEIHHYDIKSDYLGLLFRKTYPMERFQWTEDPEEIQKIIKEKYYCWYGVFDFYKIQYKHDFHIDLQRFGVPIENEMCSWSLLITNVDIEWMKKVFTWDKCYPTRLYYTRHRVLTEIYQEMFDLLFAEKESQKKGTFAKEIYKTRAELVFGQPIKSFEYNTKIIYDEKTNDFEQVDNEDKTLDQVRNELRNRGIPYYVSLWVAAYARLEFITIIDKLGFDNVVYGDTDSVWFINEEGIDIIKEHNRTIRREKDIIRKKYSVIPAEGLGEWINQGQYRNFKSIAIKTYICEKFNEETNEWELVVKAAGADSDKIKAWLLQKKKPYNHFSVYMDVPEMRYTIEYDESSVSLIYKNKIDKEELFKAQRRETNLYYYNPYEKEESK